MGCPKNQGDFFQPKHETPKQKKDDSTERTFALLKPDAIDKMGDVLDYVAQSGFNIVNMKMVVINLEIAKALYVTHQGKPYVNALLNHVLSGPVMAMELAAENAVAKWRELMGPFDPEEARRSFPKSLRARFGETKLRNAVHGALSPEAYKTENEIFFPSNEENKQNRPKTTAVFKDTTLCVIKPHAIREKQFSKIIFDIQNANFKVTAIEMFYLNKANAEEHFEIYDGVLSDYRLMIEEMVSGPCIAMELEGFGSETVTKFRELCGPITPGLAKALRPKTIRAKYGSTKVYNAVHCTDLPADGKLEVEYFFQILQTI